MTNIYHFFNRGEFTLFRLPEDYVFFNNRFAIYALKANVTVLALTIMSTHFHSVVECADKNSINELEQNLKQSYGKYFSARHGIREPRAFEMKTMLVQGIEAVRKTLIYVMKNPVHHFVTDSPFSYEYSCTPYLFLDKLLPSTMLDKIISINDIAGNISGRERRKIFGEHKVPGQWSVDREGRITPDSYVKVSRTRAFFNNSFKSFLYDMNKNAKDAEGEIIQEDLLDLRCEGPSDIDVCMTINQYVQAQGLKSFQNLPPAILTPLLRRLRMDCVTPSQARRCLWLDQNPW